jgi:hypothetical protein
MSTFSTSVESTNREGWETWFSNADLDTDGEPSSLCLNLPTCLANMAFNSSGASVWAFVPARTWDSFSSRSSCLFSMAAMR